jgi:two-component system cell cycle sensor histidine kinase/response regulator CckA
MVSYENIRGVTILLVDDEQSFRSAYARLLKREGFEVLEADGAETALALLCNKRVDVLVTDIVMPGTSGLTLGTQVKKLYPDVKALYMCGFPVRHLQQEQGVSKDLLPFILVKPFEREELIGKIWEVLDKPNSQVAAGIE